MASKAKIIEKEEVKNRIYKFFNSNNKATRKELTEYMSDLWKGEAERKKLNNMIGKIMNQDTRSNKFTKERGDKNQLVFTLVAGGLEAELEVVEVEDEEEEELIDMGEESVEAINSEIKIEEELMLDCIEDYKSEFGVKTVKTNSKKFKGFYENWKASE